MSELNRILPVLLLALALPAQAQIYKWTDAQGRTHFSNQTPPADVKAVVVDPNAREVRPEDYPQSGKDCHTLRCQGERLEERERQRAAVDAKEAREAAERAAKSPAPKAYKGLSFANYISVRRGMSEGEVLGITGEPDLQSDQGMTRGPTQVPINSSTSIPMRGGLSVKTWTFMPTASDPFTTTITLVGGRVSEVERVRKF